MRATASDAFVPGDVAHGEQIFWNQGRCGSCHMVNGRGGILGPDLSNVAAERTLQQLRLALTQAKVAIPTGEVPEFFQSERLLDFILEFLNPLPQANRR